MAWRVPAPLLPAVLDPVTSRSQPCDCSVGIALLTQNHGGEEGELMEGEEKERDSDVTARVFLSRPEWREGGGVVGWDIYSW